MIKGLLKKAKFVSFLLQKKGRLNYLLRTYLISNKTIKDFGSIHSSCQINPPIFISSPQNVFLEEFTRIQTNVSIINSNKGKVVIMRYSAIGAGCTIIPGNHIPTVGMPHFFATYGINDKDNTIVVNEDVWVGAEARLLAKAHIGRGAIIATGSIVTKEIPPYAVVAGSPAKIIAVKFNINQILEHEQRLYSEGDRFSKDFLVNLFDSYYKGLKVIGEDKFSSNELDSLWQNFGM